ncbi:MAG TPA: helix-turn-helix domain-containing protein [Acidobacteriaceae bacterium]
MKALASEEHSAVEEIYDPEAGRPRGVLRPPPPEGRMRHARRKPPADLEPWIQHFWSVRWELRGCEPFLQETVPHPNVQIVFERSGAHVAGVHTARFSTTLEDTSRVFGIKFRPGGFRPFLGSPVGALANRMVPIDQIFGSSAHQWELTMSGLEQDDALIGAAIEFLRARLPVPDANVLLATRLVDQISKAAEGESEIRSVQALARRSGMGQRSLQRLFREYVGASPKWVIRRYRLHELVERLKAGEALDGAQTALELGYCDQAHLINDFRAIIGYSPSRYRSLLRKAR